MADKYSVGSSQSKDRYVVGQNGKDKYYVGGGGKSPGQADNSSLTDGNDPVVSSKSAFKYPYDSKETYKDVGDKNDNMNFGGAVESGIKSDGVTRDGGQLQLVYSEKGDWDVKKDAMARRAGRAVSDKEVGNRSSQFQSPVVDSYPIGSTK